MNDRARGLDRLAGAQRGAERLLRRHRVDPDVREVARAVVQLTEAVALLLQPPDADVDAKYNVYCPKGGLAGATDAVGLDNLVAYLNSTHTLCKGPHIVARAPA